MRGTERRPFPGIRNRGTVGLTVTAAVRKGNLFLRSVPRKRFRPRAVRSSGFPFFFACVYFERQEHCRPDGEQKSGEDYEIAVYAERTDERFEKRHLFSAVYIEEVGSHEFIEYEYGYYSGNKRESGFFKVRYSRTIAVREYESRVQYHEKMEYETVNRRKIENGKRAPRGKQQPEYGGGIACAVYNGGQRAGARTYDVSEEYELRQTAEVQRQIGKRPLTCRQQHDLRVDFVKQLQDYYCPRHDAPSSSSEFSVKENERDDHCRAYGKPYPVNGSEFAPSLSGGGIVRDLPERRQSSSGNIVVCFHPLPQ